MSDKKKAINFGSIEFVKGKPVNLLAKDEVFEVLTFSFEAGMKMNFYTQEYDNQFNFFLLQSGKLVSHDNASTLLPGDYFFVEPFTESHILYNAEEDSLVLAIMTKDHNYTEIVERFDRQMSILKEIQLKDNYTYEHCRRVYHLCFQIAKEFDLNPNRMRNLVLAAYFHDIGKISTPDAILNKKEKLSESEFDIIKAHVFPSNDILNELTDLGIYEIAIQHHERNDGSGYPNQLTSEEILFESKILSVCDTYDAMTTDRIYKKGKSKKEALDELKMLCPQHYDASIVEILEKILE